MTIEFTPEEARILLGFLGIRIPEAAGGSRRQPAEEPAEPVPDPEEQQPDTEPKPKRKRNPGGKMGAPKQIDRGKLFALAKAGWPAAKIADELGCSTWSVRAILNNEAPYAREEEK